MKQNNSSSRIEVPSEWNQLTQRIIRCAYEVHTTLGCGLLEQVYEQALHHELELNGLTVQSQRPLTVPYKSIQLTGLRLDMIVQDLVVVELKVVEKIADAHLAQLVSYMRAADAPLGLLLNFWCPHLRDGIHRRINARSTKAIPYVSRHSVTTLPSANSETKLIASPRPPRPPLLPPR